MLVAIHEAGWVCWFAVAAMVTGLVLVLSVGRKAGRTSSVASSWSTVIVGVALLNAGAGQHKVDDRVQRQPNPADQVAMLSLGSREASSNLFVGGTCALFLMIVGGLVTVGSPRVDRREEPRAHPGR
jgi:hypothetical protein